MRIKCVEDTKLKSKLLGQIHSCLSKIVTPFDEHLKFVFPKFELFGKVLYNQLKLTGSRIRNLLQKRFIIFGMRLLRKLCIGTPYRLI